MMRYCEKCGTFLATHHIKIAKSIEMKFMQEFVRYSILILLKYKLCYFENFE